MHFIRNTNSLVSLIMRTIQGWLALLISLLFLVQCTKAPLSQETAEEIVVPELTAEQEEMVDSLMDLRTTSPHTLIIRSKELLQAIEKDTAQTYYRFWLYKALYTGYYRQGKLDSSTLMLDYMEKLATEHRWKYDLYSTGMLRALITRQQRDLAAYGHIRKVRQQLAQENWRSDSILKSFYLTTYLIEMDIIGVMEPPDDSDPLELFYRVNYLLSSDSFPEQEAQAYYSLGYHLFTLRNFTEAEEAFFKCWESTCDVPTYNNLRLRANSMQWIGLIHKEEWGNEEVWHKLTVDALEYFKTNPTPGIVPPLKSLIEYAIEVNDREKVDSLLIVLDTYQPRHMDSYHLGQRVLLEANLAAYDQDYPTAIALLDSAEKIDPSLQTEGELMEARHRYYAGMGNHRMAYVQLDSLRKYQLQHLEENSARTEEMQESRLALAKKEAEAASLRQEQKIQATELKTQSRLIWAALLLLLVTVGFMGYLIYLWRKLHISNWHLTQKTEQLAAARDRAEEASQAKANFLSMMSHEIRTPMNGVIGMTELLSETPLTREQRDYLQTINVSADSLLTILNDILDFNKIESGKLELESTPISISKCTEEVIELFSQSVHEKGLYLLYDPDPTLPQHVLGDPTRYKQVLGNLVSNALKFTHQGGIRIHIGMPHGLPANPEASFPIEVRVEDTGIGITADQQRKLFNAFSQADASISRKYGGTGLGLAISQRLCELMGGKIWVKSTEGTGSTFGFSIQTQVVEVKTEKINGESHSHLKDRQILLIGQSKSQLSIINTHLNAWGAKVDMILTNTPHLDRTSIPQYSYDMAVIDHQPGVLDGPTVAKCCLDRGLISQSQQVVMLAPGTSFSDNELKFVGQMVVRPLLLTKLKRALNLSLSAEPHDYIQPLKLYGEDRPFLGKSILVAEDNLTNQKLVKRMLHKLGCKVVLAPNGQLALEAALERPFDLILMDIQMPTMNGLEATYKICEAISADVRPPIVAMTANALGSDKEACFKAGMVDHLSKPFRKEQLREMMLRYVPPTQRVS